MKPPRLAAFAFGLLFTFLLTGCKTYDYTNYRAHFPKSILVLPPLNETTDVKGTYSYLSTITRPLGELGYYVYPVEVVDQFFKENGMPTAGEMHQAPLDKLREVFGADAVLYITLERYGTKYLIINSVTEVQARCKLVDTSTGLLLWEGTVMASKSTGFSGLIPLDMAAALVGQAVSQSTDQAHSICPLANVQFGIKSKGLLLGPRHPEFGKEK
jgi:hypothetical protein